MKSRIIWSNYNQNQNQGYISLHVIKINELHFTSFYVIFYVISCYISRHFMFHFTHFIVHIACIAHISRMSRISHCTYIVHFMPFHVIFHVISCCILHISLYALHTSHACHTCHACRVIRISWTTCILCITLYVASFYVSFHVISSWKLIAYSFIPFRSEESRKWVKTAHSSIERLPSEAF